MSRGIPVEHLAHLVSEAGLPDGEKQALLKSLRLSDTGVRNAVVAKLEELNPGTRTRLLNMWGEYGGRAVHLWNAHVLSDANAEKLLQFVHERLPKKKRVALGATVEIPKPAKLPPHGVRVKWIRITPDELEAQMRLRVERRVTDEDEAVIVPASRDVRIRIDLAEPDRLTVVFGALKEARTALCALVEWLLNTKIPSDKKDVVNLLEPVVFNESHAGDLRRKLDFKRTGFFGKLTEGKNGEMLIRGKKDATGVRQEIDLAEDHVKRQEAASNYVREFVYNHKHNDAYSEPCELSFYFKSTHPHLTFKSRVSEDAMRYVLGQLADAVRNR